MLKQWRISKPTGIFVLVFGCCLLTAVLLSAHSTGPKAGVNGGLAGQTCNQSDCHNTFTGVNLAASKSAITLSGFPSGYIPGQTYTLQITVGLINPADQTSPPRRRYGFQLSARSPSSPFNSLGTLTLTQSTTGYDFVLGDGTQPTPVVVNGAVYVSHNSSGTCVNGTSCTWSVNWTAPNPAAGPVEFDVAGNSANGDQDHTGDYILTTSLTINELSLPAPQFASSNPSFPHIGPQGGGTSVTVNGQNFVSGSQVLFGGVAGTTTFVSATQLTAVTPAAGAPGAVDIQVVNPDNKSATLNKAFTYFDDSLKIADAISTTSSASKMTESDAAGVSPVGSGIFNFTQNNTLVTTTGTPSATPTTKFLLFADSNPLKCSQTNCALPNNTGLAIINQSGATAHLTFILRKADGTGVASLPNNQSLGNGQHFQGFMTDIFGSPANNFTGTIEVDSDQPVSALTLEQTTNQAPRNEVLFTSFPVADLVQAPAAGNLVFSQLADGGGFQSRIVLMNTTNKAISGKILLNKDDPSSPNFNFIGIGPVSQVPYNIPSMGEFSILSAGVGPLTVGYAVVVPDNGSSSPVGTGVFILTSNGFTVTSFGVPSSPALNYGVILSDTNPSSAGLAQNTGVAIANLSPTQSAEVDFTLLHLDGSGADATVQKITVPPGGHIAEFVDQIFTDGMAGNFTGTMAISTASSPGIAALTLIQTTNQRGDVLFTTLPVATPSSSTDPVFFPQLVSGGGFATQLILLNPAGVASVGTLNFLGGLGASNGQPIILPLNDSLSSSFNFNIPSNGGALFR
ncbi:MAG: IPT/TIG domain-containing protein [Acidobacteriia bacterium]|nr:IPT/TIG domain-containing protein [Terriglobia bacterium]